MCANLRESTRIMPPRIFVIRVADGQRSLCPVGPMLSSQRVGGRVVGPEQSSAEAGESFAGLADQTEDVVLTGAWATTHAVCAATNRPHVLDGGGVREVRRLADITSGTIAPA